MHSHAHHWNKYLASAKKTFCRLRLTTAFKNCGLTGLFQQRFTNRHYQVGMTERSPFAAFGYAFSASNLLAKSNNFRFFGMTVTGLMSSKYRNFLKPATLCKIAIDNSYKYEE
jgi:hypothetical protein